MENFKKFENEISESLSSYKKLYDDLLENYKLKNKRKLSILNHTDPILMKQTEKEDNDALGSFSVKIQEKAISKIETDINVLLNLITNEYKSTLE